MRPRLMYSCQEKYYFAYVSHTRSHSVLNKDRIALATGASHFVSEKMTESQLIFNDCITLIQVCSYDLFMTDFDLHS